MASLPDDCPQCAGVELVMGRHNERLSHTTRSDSPEFHVATALGYDLKAELFENSDDLVS